MMSAAQKAHRNDLKRADRVKRKAEHRCQDCGRPSPTVVCDRCMAKKQPRQQEVYVQLSQYLGGTRTDRRLHGQNAAALDWALLMKQY